MSRTYHHSKYRQIRVRSVKRKPTDLKRLARALIELEYQAAQTEVEAEVEHQARKNGRAPKGGKA